MVELRANTRNFLPALYVTSVISLGIARSSRFRISSFPATISNFSAVKMIILVLFRLQQNLVPRFLFFLINMKKRKGKLEARRIEESGTNDHDRGTMQWSQKKKGWANARRWSSACISLHRWQGPQCRCLVCRGTEEREFRRMPSPGDYLVLVLGHDHAG